MIFAGAGLELFFNKTTFGVERLSVQGDPESLSWVKGKNFGLPTGNNFLLKRKCEGGQFIAEFLYFCGVVCTLTVSEKEGAISYRYLFKNEGKKPVRVEEGEFGVYLPFRDDFDLPEISLRRRVHAHVRPQGGAYVYCERYSGDLPSMGVVFVRGESDSYSLERSARRVDRGEILLNLPAMTLEVGATYECEFLLFASMGREDFFRKAEGYGLLTATTSALAVFDGEEITLRSSAASLLRGENGEEIPFAEGVCSFRAKGEGDHVAHILAEDGRSLTLRYFVIPDHLETKRVSFLSENHYIREGRYRGAFAAFDRAAGEKVVRKGVRSPLNLAGYRAAPLLFLLSLGRRGLLSDESEEMLLSAVEFYDREVYRDGEVSDDVGGRRARFGKRYYNYPLYAAIKLEEYLYGGKESCLIESAAILSTLYKSGAVYEVSPTVRVVEALREVGKNSIVAELAGLVSEAADKLISTGNKYAPFKGLPYGPEIVCGALSTLLDAYELTGKEYYLMTAKEHLARLDAFSFPSLDYSTDDVPKIFQKDRGNGLIYDMSPHFTAAYFALVYDRYYRLTGEEKYLDLSRRIIRAALTLFDEKGRSARSKAAAKSVNDIPLTRYEEISCGEDVVLYYFDLIFERK